MQEDEFRQVPLDLLQGATVCSGAELDALTYPEAALLVKLERKYRDSQQSIVQRMAPRNATQRAVRLLCHTLSLQNPPATGGCPFYPDCQLLVVCRLGQHITERSPVGITS